MTTPRLEALEIECEKLRSALEYIGGEGLSIATHDALRELVHLKEHARKALAQAPISAKLVQLREADAEIVMLADSMRHACFNTGNYGPLKIQPGKCTCTMCKLKNAFARRREILEEMKR